MEACANRQPIPMMNIRKVICWVLLVWFNTGNASERSYTAELSQYFVALLATAEASPNQALSSLAGNQANSPAERAQVEFVRSQINAILDYPEKIIEHSQLGLAAIDAQQEPWLTHLLTLAKIDGYDRLGQGHDHMSELEQILAWSNEHEHPILATLALIQMSYLYISQEDYKQALLLIQQATDLAPDEHILISKADVSSHTAGIYVARHEFDLALPYFEAAYESEKAQGNTLGMSIQLFEMGRANIELENHELGIQQLQQSIELSESVGDDQGVAYANTELAYHFIKQEAFDRAETLLDRATEIFTRAGNNYLLFDNLILLAQVKTETGEFAEAQDHIDAAAALNANGTFRYGQVAVDKRQAHLLSAMGNHAAAFELFVEATKRQSELENQHSSEKLHEIRTRYEVEKNNLKNQMLAEENSAQSLIIANQKRQSLLLTLSLVMMAALLGLLLWFNRRYRLQSNQLHVLANFDELTGLRNRSGVVNRIRKKLAKMNDDDRFTLVMIDLDHFKTINDNYGHALGDRVLREFGALCADLKSHTKLIGRMGGEEFLLGFEDLEPNDIQQLIEQLRINTQQLSDSIPAPGLKISLSAGICHSHGSHRLRDIMKCADEAMYRAKHNGRNQIVSTRLN